MTLQSARDTRYRGAARVSILEAALEQAWEETDRIFLPATVLIFLGLVALGLLIEVFNLILK